MNKVILIGNLTKDPEMRTTTNGKQVASCSIATNKSYKDQSGQKQTIAQFHNLVVWGKPAEVFAQYLKKGSKVAIVGELQTRNYDDKSGVKRYVTEVVVNEFEFLTPNTGNNQSSSQEYSQPEPVNDFSQPEPNEDEIRVENIPF